MEEIIFKPCIHDKNYDKEFIPQICEEFAGLESQRNNPI